jgi:ubiquinone/menaquinone biosynthesis C-methylase UbiE
VTESKGASRRHFDRWARVYERDWTSRWLGRLQQQALESLELSPGDRLLDVGCGTGAAVRRAAPLVERAVGVDLSPMMIARARELGAGLAEVEFLEADAESLPFADGEFTALLCSTSFHHYPNAQVAVHEMARVLAPGGRVAIADGSSDGVPGRLVDAVLRRVQRGHVSFRRSGEIGELLGRAGLSVAATRHLLGGSYMIVVGRRPATPG